MSRIVFGVIVCLALCMAGCGGSNTDDVRSAVSHMQDVIRAYNGSSPANLSAVAAACSKAAIDLEGSTGIETVKLTGKLRAEQQILAQAYAMARQGFADCAAGSSSLDFPRTVRGEQEIATANAAIVRARQEER